MINPPAGPITLGIMMSPVNYATLAIPLVFPAQLNGITGLHGNPGGKVNIVADKDRVPTTQFENESLVTGAFIIVGECAVNRTCRFDHDARGLEAEQSFDGSASCVLIILCLSTISCRWLRIGIPYPCQNKNCNPDQYASIVIHGERY